MQELFLVQVAVTWRPSGLLMKHILFIDAMPRQKFRDILRYLHCDDTNTRTVRAETNQFTLMSELFQLLLQWPRGGHEEDIKVDEQLSPAKVGIQF